MMLLQKKLKKRLINQDFNYYHLTKRAYMYLPNFDFKNVDNGKIDKSYIKFSKKIRNKILSNNKNIAIIGARYPLWLSGYYFDNQTYFSNNCSGTTSIQEHNITKALLKVTDLLGRETKLTNQPLLYIYDDGTVEKRITID